MPHTKRPLTSWILFGLACFEVISAVPYGLALSLQPSGSWVSMSTEMLAGSPFRDFRVPGLILLLVIGLGALVLAFGLYRTPSWTWAIRLNPCKRRHWVLSAAIAYGVALIIWIATEVLLIGFDSWLQPLHFAVGAAFVLLSLTPSMRRHSAMRAEA